MPSQILDNNPGPNVTVNGAPVFIIFSPIINISYIKQNPEPFQDIIPAFDECATASNAWLYLNYLGSTVEPAPKKADLEKEINAGKKILLFKVKKFSSKDIPKLFSDKVNINAEQIDYAFDQEFISTFPLIAETDNYLLLGYEDKCAAVEPVIMQ